MGSRLSFRAESVNTRPFLLPIKFAFQQGDQFIWWSKLHFAQVRRDNGPVRKRLRVLGADKDLSNMVPSYH